MTFRVFYDRKNFFGEWEYNADETTAIHSQERLVDVFRKCMNSFGRVRNFCFRIELDKNGEMWIVEQSMEDAQGGVYNVTYCRAWNSIETPQKMSGRALKKVLMAAWEQEQNAVA